MSELPIALVVASTFLHAGWNVLLRHRRREGPFVLRMLLTTALVGCVPACLAAALLYSFFRDIWLYVVCSGLFCGGYYLCLVRAYSSADFTTVYPIARALPVLLVGLADVIRGRPPTGAAWVGMSLVVAGCVFCPLRSFRDVSLRRYWNRSSLWMVLTALGTVGYTLFDKVAAERLPAGPGPAATYCTFFFLISLAGYAAGYMVTARRQERPAKTGWRQPILAASFCFTAYWLVLWAYQMTGRAGYVVAFRQFSIVVGVILGFIAFRERGRAVRLTGTGLIVAGLACIALWGG